MWKKTFQKERIEMQRFSAQNNCYCFRKWRETNVARMMETKACAMEGYRGHGKESEFYLKRNDKPLDVLNYKMTMYIFAKSFLCMEIIFFLRHDWKRIRLWCHPDSEHDSLDKGDGDGDGKKSMDIQYILWSRANRFRWCVKCGSWEIEDSFEFLAQVWWMWKKILLLRSRRAVWGQGTGKIDIEDSIMDIFGVQSAWYSCYQYQMSKYYERLWSFG